MGLRRGLGAGAFGNRSRDFDGRGGGWRDQRAFGLLWQHRKCPESEPRATCKVFGTSSVTRCSRVSGQFPTGGYPRATRIQSILYTTSNQPSDPLHVSRLLSAPLPNWRLSTCRFGCEIKSIVYSKIKDTALCPPPPLPPHHHHHRQHHKTPGSPRALLLRRTFHQHSTLNIEACASQSPIPIPSTFQSRWQHLENP